MSTTDTAPTSELASERQATLCNDAEDDILDVLTIDCLVDVEDRMWPGMNKQGGIARVKAIDRANRAVNLHYVVDRRKEKNVSLEFITLAPQYDIVQRPSSSTAEPQQSSSLRDRSMLLGRCKRCGSLRADCGSCDWLEEERRLQNMRDSNSPSENSAAPKRSSKTNKTSRRKRSDDLFDLSSEDELEELIQHHQRRFQRFKRLRTKQEREWKDYVKRQKLEGAQALAKSRGSDDNQDLYCIKQKHKHTIHPRILETSESEDETAEDQDADSDSFFSSEDEHIPLQHLSLCLGSSMNRVFQLKQKYRSPLTNITTSPKTNSNMNKYRVNVPHEAMSGRTFLVRRHNKTSQRLQRPLETRSEVQDVTQIGESDTSPTHSPAIAYERISGLSQIEDIGDQDLTQGDNEFFSMDREEEEKEREGHDQGQNEYVKALTQGPEEDRFTALAQRHVAESTFHQEKNRLFTNETDELQEFIQPEGEDAAENLPEDTINRAMMTEYKDLPRFFDDEAKNIEDEILPNAKLKVAELERRINTWKKMQDGSDDEKRNVSRETSEKELVEAIEDIMADMRINLIRNGVDQCRSALRKLLDDQCYRNERRKLSDQEKKVIRRERDILSLARDVKMEELDQEIETLARKVRTMACFLGSAHDDNLGDQQLSSSTSVMDADTYVNVDTDSEREYDTEVILKDLAATTYAAGIDDCSIFDISQKQSTWDKHHHARRVRHQSQKVDYYANKENKERKATERTKFTGRKHDTPMPTSSWRRTTSKKRTLPSSNKYEHSLLEKMQHNPTELAMTGGPGNTTWQSQKRVRKDEEPQRNGPRRGRKNKKNQPSDFNKPNCLSSYFHDSSESNEAALESFARNQVPKDSGETFSGPRLDDLLAISGTGYGRNYAKESSSSWRNPQKPMADRMQAFLEVNAEMSDLASFIDETSEQHFIVAHSKSPWLRKGRKRLGISSPKESRSEKGQSASNQDATMADPWCHQSDEDAEYSHEDLDASTAVAVSSVDTEHLFSQLNVKNSRAAQVPHQPWNLSSIERHGDLSILCESLKRQSLSNSPKRTIRLIKVMAAKTVAQSAAQDTSNNNNKSAALAFGTLLDMIQRQGSPILQDLVTRRDNPYLRVQVALLVETIKLVESGISCHLSSHDGITYQIFSAARSTNFVKLVLLQLVDSVYSLFHPSAWALTFEKESRVTLLNILTPLRDAIGKIISSMLNKGSSSLTEAVCACIVNEMDSQKWRIVESPSKHAFVSSIDPEAWITFLQTGTMIEKPKATRISSFKDNLPRCEAEALWSVLAYFAGDLPQPVPGKSDICWRLVSKFLFLGATFGGRTTDTADSAGIALPPHPSQLLACKKELYFLTSLLHAGAMENLPKNDGKMTEIIKKALQLQVDDSSVATYPINNSGRADIKRLKKLWNIFNRNFDTGLVASVREERIGLPEFGRETIDIFLGAPSLLPSSDIVRQCIALQFTWIKKIPSGKARFSRFVTALRSFIQDLLNDATRIEQCDPSKENGTRAEVDPFALAFPVVADMSSTVHRKALLYREAAAYHLIFSAVAFQHSRGKELQDEKINGICSLTDIAGQLWEMLSDKAMEYRQKSMTSSHQDSPFSGDDYRLLVAGRAMTCLALSLLGVPTWAGDVLDGQPSFVLGNWAAKELAEDGLQFMTSCLVACIDCLCDVTNYKLEIQACLWTYLASIFYHCARVLESRSSEFDHLIPGILALRHTLDKMLSPTFKRSLVVLVGAHFATTHGDLCLRAMLLALRGSLFLETRIRRGAFLIAPPPTQRMGDQELFGDLDDETLAAFDLNAIEGRMEIHTNRSDTDPCRLLFQFLSEVLQRSMPSRKYSIETHSGTVNSNSNEWDISVPGKSLIFNHSRYICACMAAICFNGETSLSSAARTILDPWQFGASSKSQDDLFHCKQLAQFVSVDLCNLAYDLPERSAVLRTNYDCILLNLIETLLDIDILAKFPTCNAARVKESSGKYAEQKEISRLLALNQISQNRTTTKDKKSIKLGGEVWEFCSRFGSSLRVTANMDKEETGMISCASVLGEVLLHYDEGFEDSSFENLRFASMEKESLKRIGILAAMIDLFSQRNSNQDAEQSTFERISAQIIGTSAANLLVLSKRRDLLELAVETRQGETGHQKGKNFELFSSFVELHITLLAWMLSRCPLNVSEGFSSLVQYIGNSYLIPILLEQSIDVISTLKEVISATSLIQRGDRRTLALKSFRGIETTFEIEVLYESVLRRSRELLLHVALNGPKSSGLLNALQFAAMGGKQLEIDSPKKIDSSAIIGASFSSSSGTTQIALTNIGRVCSPIQDAIDRYFQEKYPANTWQIQVLGILRQKFLTDALLPRLNHLKTVTQRKKNVMRLIQTMISSDYSPWTLGAEQEGCFHNLRDLARGLSLTLRSCLGSEEVDPDLVSSVFSCAKYLARSGISLPLLDDSEILPVAQWCRSASEIDDYNTAAEVDQIRAFLWVSFMWLKDVSSALIEESEGSIERLQKFRQTIKTGDEWLWPSGSSSSDAEKSRIADLIVRLFPVKRRDLKIQNIYAKKSRTESEKDNQVEPSMEVWVPEARVRRAAKEFMIELIPLC